jgi:hypothetical protein
MRTLKLFVRVLGLGIGAGLANCKTLQPHDSFGRRTLPAIRLCLHRLRLPALGPGPDGARFGVSARMRASGNIWSIHGGLPTRPGS